MTAQKTTDGISNFILDSNLLILNCFLNCHRVCVLTRERDREKGVGVAERKHLPMRCGHSAVPSAFLHPIGILGPHAHMPGTFFKPPELELELHGEPCAI